MEHISFSGGTKHFIDTLSGLTIVSTMVGWLPFILAIPGAVWYSIQIYNWYKGRDQRSQEGKK